MLAPLAIMPASSASRPSAPPASVLRSGARPETDCVKTQGSTATELLPEMTARPMPDRVLAAVKLVERVAEILGNREGYNGQAGVFEKVVD
jgi:hypothetical protein